MTRKKKNNIIIISLLAVVLLMAVGYAAFSSVLNISGTGSITSSWNIRITNVEVSNIVGDASDGEGTTYQDLTATINSKLVSPGDSITYDVTIRNDGSLDAVLTDINLTKSTNPAISFSTSNLTEGTELGAGEEAILKVTVTYNNSVTSQPEDTSADLSVTLTYEQKGSGTIIPGEDIVDITDNVVSVGDGLYEDEYEEGRYVYKGANPNNYIAFGEETTVGEYIVTMNGEDAGAPSTFTNQEDCQAFLEETFADSSIPDGMECTFQERANYTGGLWRIISKEADGTYKIVKNDLLSNRAWDTTGGIYGSNNWVRPADLNTYLNGEYYESLDSSITDYIVSHTWGIGAVTMDNNDLADQISDENGTTWNSNIGLISVSDYLRANTNTEQCGTYISNNDNYLTCKTTDWLFKDESYWTISPRASSSNLVFRVDSTGHVYSFDVNYSSFALCPAAYLSSDIILSGMGTSGNPYVITN